MILSLKYGSFERTINADTTEFQWENVGIYLFRLTSWSSTIGVSMEIWKLEIIWYDLTFLKLLKGNIFLWMTIKEK